MAILELFKANGRRVVFWKPKGTFPVGESPFPGMDNNVLKKVARVCKCFLDTGEFPNNDTKFKRIFGYSPLSEIKPDKQWRIFGYLADLRTFVVVSFVRKKQNKHDKGVLSDALDLIKQHKTK